jgi:hypothetical protein
MRKSISESVALTVHANHACGSFPFRADAAALTHHFGSECPARPNGILRLGRCSRLLVLRGIGGAGDGRKTSRPCPHNSNNHRRLPKLTHATGAEQADSVRLIGPTDIASRWEGSSVVRTVNRLGLESAPRARGRPQLTMAEGAKCGLGDNAAPAWD